MHPFDPQLELRHRCKVYKFGARWHWKCYETRCRGGSFHTLETAFLRAEQHCDYQGQED